jgi:DEAD/DEAH box helicase domain-containing protein
VDTPAADERATADAVGPAVGTAAVDERGARLLRRVLAGTPRGESPLTYSAVLPARAAVVADWPSWTPATVVDALRAAGIKEPWSHQVAAAEAAWRGEHVILATGTASGKSLAYQLPVLSSLTLDPRATALYLSPTKALAADQLRALSSLGVPGVRAAACDGDTPLAERDWVRAHSRWVFTNPDMLHRSILPAHGRWASWLRRLRYVVIDECHAYRGVFGSHVALLLRRLRRVAARYGASPVFVLASATVATPAASASALLGLPVVEVTEDGSPRGARTVALWEPPLLRSLAGENGAPVRRSAGAESARLLADLVIEGARTLVFVRSRRGAELAALGARRVLSEVSVDLAGRVAAYRAGYLPEERRALEAALATGELLGVASTNALELGVDIAGLDAVVVAGYPGTVASFWQQAGRAGRSGEGALVVFVARDDPLDTYLAHHPPALLGRPLEACVLDPANPYVLEPQLACAAAELPLAPSEVDDLFGPAAPAALDSLAAQGFLRRRSTGWFWAVARERPHGTVDIRGSGGEPIVVVESDTGRMLGTVDQASAHTQVHPGALYLHQGRSYVVDALELDESLALVHAEEPSWSTSARSIVDISVLGVVSSAQHGSVGVALGEVEVTTQVVGYLRRAASGEVLDHVPLDLPPRCLRTRAVWYTLSGALLAAAGLSAAQVPGALHAAEHAAIGLLPLFAVCDRWDIGGVSTALHPDTGAATVFVHDGHPGGAGFADRGFAALRPWLAATRDAIAACECPAGCPSCVQSPKCGNGNEPLDKAGAIQVLDAVLTQLPS